jgi:hypothetical protein
MPASDLRQALIDLALRHDYEEAYGALDHSNPDLERILWMLMSEDLLPAVVKDWAKIDVSTENLYLEEETVTPDGIPYFMLKIGGDWENPIIAILYHDGKTFRGYIPKAGNPYNHAKKAAFGNDDSDLKAAQTQFRYTGDDDPIDIDPDLAAIRQDIESRLEARGTYTHQRGPIVSKAKVKAKAQAELEKSIDLSGPITPDMVYAVIHLAAGCSYVEFILRVSGRTLTQAECDRLVGVPAVMRKHTMASDSTTIWYSPDGYYPVQTHQLLTAAGFEKDPNNDISMYAGARTIYIHL